MDTLGDLRASLGVRTVRTREGGAAPAPAPDADPWAGLDAAQAPPSLAQEIQAKYGGKTQPESRQLVAILGAVQEVVKAQGLEVTPTAMFAALMASMEKPETAASSEVLAAMCHLLSIVLGRVPNAILRAKFGAGSAVLCGIVESKQADAAVVKNAVPCLGQLLAAFNHADWPSAVRPFNLLLGLSLDGRAKVRRAAQAAVADTLAGLQAAAPALGPASEAVLKLCQRVLPGPEAAAHAAAAAPSKKRAAAEEAIAAAVADALHLLGALKAWIPLLAGPAAAPICDLLLKLYPLRQPLLSRHATEVLTALAAAPGGHLTARGLGELVGAALAAEQLWERRADSAATAAAVRLVEEGLCRLAALDAGAAAARLPRAFHTLVPQLASEHDGVRYAAGCCLKNLVNECVDQAAVDAALAGAAAGGGKAPPPLLSVLASLEGSLGAHYQEAWDSCLPVCAEMLEKLGARGAPLAAGLLERLGELCAGGDEAAEQDRVVDDAVVLAAQDALGAAMRSLGPETVLAALPLNLAEGLAGSGEARTWLLPLLRMHVRGARLGYWGKVLLPLAREMGSRAAAAASTPARAREAQVCGALEAQLWATLPSFCSWAQDAAEALKLYAKLLAAAFEKRPELRVTICHALRRLCQQNRAALAAAGEPVGWADPCAAPGEGEEGAGAGGEEQEAAHAEVPEGYTAEMAREAVAVLRAQAKNWMPLLLNTYVATPAVQRGQVERAVAAYACVCEPAAAAQFFRAAITKLIKVQQQAASGELGPGAVLEGGDTDVERRATFLELALALAGGLDASALDTLYKAARPGIQEREPAVQKKSYKVLAYLCESRPDFFEPRFAEVVHALLEALPSSLSAAKRNRLRCLKAAVLAMAQPDGPRLEGTEGASREEATKQMVASLVSEIILCVKERNKATRATAFDLLVQIAHAMHEAEPPAPAELGGSDDDEAMGEDGAAGQPRGGLHTLFTMVLGGLVGATPHMISAAVMALARLLYEFAPVLAGLVPDLLPAVLLLLRSKAREVIKSVLGFVKVVSLRLPADELTTFLPQILEGILLWAEDSKNKFRAKVRWIVEKLAKRCGFDAVAAHMPEAHSKLLAHIRKENSRRERRRSEAGSQMDVDEAEEARSRRSRADTAARTARRSEWDEAVFSDSEDEGAARTARTARTRQTEGGRSARAARAARDAAPGGRLPGAAAGGDPLDLLDSRATRQLVGGGGARARRGAAGAAAGDDVQFETDASGKLVIKDDKKKRKRAADDGWDSDDSDFEDLKGFERSGLSLALRGAKSVALAPSIAASLGGRSLGAKSAGAASRGGRSAGARSAASQGGRSVKNAKGSQHSGDRFKAKKKGTGGDVKGSAKVDPYAYWPLDRRLMNRRQQKAKGAKKGLDKVVAAAKEGAARGSKAKRQRQR